MTATPTATAVRPAAPTGTAATTATTAAGGGHLRGVDVVRLLTVATVIVVHGTAFMLPHDDVGAGAVLTVLHVNRAIFLFLSAFVLTYSTRTRPLSLQVFWRRRVPLVLAPYAAWTAIYVLSAGAIASPLAMTGRVVKDLLDGDAKYHMYFLLVTLQLYAVFPWLLRMLGRWRDRRGRVLGVCAAFQLAFSAAIHYQVPVPAPLDTWMAHPSPWLPSYALYIVSGVIAAWNLDAITGWLRANGALVLGLFTLAVGGAIASYAIDLRVFGMPVLRASEVFQPVVVVESMAFIAGQYALGLWVVDRLGTRGNRELARATDMSFGIYLVHPLLLQLLLTVMQHTALGAAWGRLPHSVALLLVFVAVMPALYLVAALAVGSARRTRLSLALTGRPSKPRSRVEVRRSRHVPIESPAVVALS